MSVLKKWDIIKSDIVIENQWIKIRKDVCRLSNYMIIDDYFIIEKPDIVAIFPVNKEGKVVLVKQYKHGIQKILLELPGGYIEKNETPLQAAIRELLEETGYSSNQITKIGTVINDSSNASNIIHVFLAERVSKKHLQSLDLNEEILIELIDIHKLKEFIISGKITAQTSIATTFLALNHLNLKINHANNVT